MAPVSPGAQKLLVRPWLGDDFSESTTAIRLLRELGATAMDEQLKEFHRIICPDLSLRDFVIVYKDAGPFLEISLRGVSDLRFADKNGCGPQRK